MTDNFTPAEDDIILRKMQEAKEEIDAGRAKTDQQREAEAIKAEMDTLGASMQTHYRNPSRFEAELKTEEAHMAELSARLGQIGAEKPVDPGTAAGIRFNIDKRYHIGADGLVEI